MNFQPNTWEPEWWLSAACAQWDVDPEIFAKAKAGKPATKKEWDPWREARKVCNDCPVRTKCLTETLREGPMGDNGAFLMFAGGLSPQELTNLARKQARA